MGLQTCDHTGCEFPHRLEYCEVEGRDIEGDAAVVIDMITNLLYERGDFERCVEYSNNGTEKYITRDFQYLHADHKELLLWPIFESRIRITHKQTEQPQGDSYEVRTGWRVHQTRASEAFYETVYTLEDWNHAIHATIDEYHISTDQLKSGETPAHRSRPMTGYDHQVLFDKLAELDSMRVAEEQEHAALNP